jgi:hypothetical protein
MKSKAERIEASIKDICYEVTSLLQASDFYHQARLKRDWSPDKEKREIGKAISNIALESFLLHYRNLNEFLHNMGKRDSVNAKDYAPTWNFERITRKNPNAKQHPQLDGQTEIERIHKRLAHISGIRSDLDARWMLPQTLERICDVFENFIRAVPGPEKIKFEEAIKALQQHRAMTVQTVLAGDGNRTDSAQILPSASFWALDFKITK